MSQLTAKEPSDALDLIRTGAALDAMTDADLDARELEDIRHRHIRVFHAIDQEKCDPACAGAIDPLGPCRCQCDGAYHADLWAITIRYGIPV